MGREVLRRTGLEAEALARGTGEEGTAFLREDGRAAATFALDPTKKDGQRDGMTAEMEILRGDLARLLHDALPSNVTTRYGDSIAAIEPDTGRVTFAGGTTETYDAILVAEGVGSATREKVLPGAAVPRWMDLTMAYFTIPRTDSDDRLWRWTMVPGKRSISLRPDRHGTARAMLAVHKTPTGEQDWGVDRQKAWLHETFAGVGWETPRILAAMDGAQDFYFEPLRQMRLPRWSRGRVALVGDAAWCVTPLAGMGATLAVVGGYTLAGELSQAGDVRAGFTAYEEAMRPSVEKAQAIPKLAPRLMHPRTRLGIGLLHGALGLASRPAVQAIVARVARTRQVAPTLPDYRIVPG